MNIVLSAGKLVQLAVLAFAGWLLLQSLFLSVQTFMVFYFPTTNVPYLHPVPPANETAELISLAWKEPFEYEAKVYVNNKPRSSRMPPKVWHIEPQSLANRYPVFEKRLGLNLTDTDTRFMCVFIQKAGQFTPHPNISDPHLVVDQSLIATTSILTTCYNDDQKGKGIKAHCVSKSTFRVDTQAKWKIHLEDNCTVVHGKSLGTSAKDVYLPLLYLDSDAKSEWKKFPLANRSRINEEPEALSATVDIAIGIRGASNRIERRVNDEVYRLFKLNEGKLLAPRLNLWSSTASSTVSTAIYLALYPALLSLWLIRQLYIARLYLASACSNSGKANSIFAMYIFQEISQTTLIGTIGLVVPHAGLDGALVNLGFAWCLMKFLLGIMPQRRVASVIRYLSGSRATNTSDREKDDESLQTKETKENDPESAYSEICSWTFKLLLVAIGASLVVEYAYQAYISGGIDIQYLHMSDGSQVHTLFWAIDHLSHRLVPWIYATYFTPSIILVFKRKSTTYVPIAYHLLQSIEFAVIGSLCLYAVPSVVNGICSIILLIQWIYYNKL
ncbi:hypothetical protein DL89DRAFT_265064 [Linderina pennispora]|uniref:Uncharacterized protein n=1 Tax=Linderina pennispora TaxID=61395 RepID=A0A1Y1WIE2_9FUNG|nr:uncharacterized protein DL89DRAFT_265064 [Linderina pennispora]ORX72884.1 hypothetical protein DL89DRAFT_265064 [Linderina pennispora]